MDSPFPYLRTAFASAVVVHSAASPSSSPPVEDFSDVAAPPPAPRHGIMPLVTADLIPVVAAREVSGDVNCCCVGEREQVWLNLG